jgi:hypothetical protein
MQTVKFTLVSGRYLKMVISNGNIKKNSANFRGWRVPRGQRDGSLRRYSRLSRPEPLLFLSSSSSVVITRLSGPRSRPTSQKIWHRQESNSDLYICSTPVIRKDMQTSAGTVCLMPSDRAERIQPAPECDREHYLWSATFMTRHQIVYPCITTKQPLKENLFEVERWIGHNGPWVDTMAGSYCTVCKEW